MIVSFSSQTLQIQELKKKLEDLAASQQQQQPAVGQLTSSRPPANPGTPKRVTRSSLAEKQKTPTKNLANLEAKQPQSPWAKRLKTPTKEAPHQDLRRSPRLKEKRKENISPQQNQCDADAGPSTSGQAEEAATSSTVTPRCMVNTATGKSRFLPLFCSKTVDRDRKCVNMKIHRLRCQVMPSTDIFPLQNVLLFILMSFCFSDYKASPCTSDQY